MSPGEEGMRTVNTEPLVHPHSDMMVSADRGTEGNVPCIVVYTVTAHLHNDTMFSADRGGGGGGGSMFLVLLCTQ